MKTASLRNALLALAAVGLVAAPAAASPSAPYGRGVGAYGASGAGYNDHGGDRGRQRGWYKSDRRERQDYRYDRYRSGYQQGAYYNSYPVNYRNPVYNNSRVWRSNDGRYYCRRSNGTTGLLVGGAAGALLGREIAGRGDRTLGAVLGAAGGALLGKSIDSGSRCR